MRPWAIGVVALAACGGEPPDLPEDRPLTCGTGCGGALGSATLPGPHGAVSLTAWSNSPQLGTDFDCDPTACAGTSPVTARNGHPAYGCAWQCVEIVNRYFQGSWGAPKIAANAGATFCQRAASSSLPQYWVYGQYGASAAGHAPIAGDVLVWAGHVAIATNSVSPGAAGTIHVIEQNATCSGFDTVSWSGSMFGAKYGLAPLCWVHVLANVRTAPPPPPPPDAGVAADAGTPDAGAGDDAGSEPADAGAPEPARDAGHTAIRVDAPPDASSAGCSSRGAASILGLLALAILRRRCRAPVLSP